MQGANGVGIKGIQQLPLATNIKLEGKSAIKEASRSDFLEKFEKIKSENVKEELENIFGKITEQADKIGEKMYLKDILEYKKLVKEFLNVATQNSHQFQNQNFLDRRGRHRNYSIVKTVDRELDTLTREFINGQIDHMGVLKKIDDIRGMLLDIMM
ncbi:conserved protein of unknown function [Acetoanaerobium sticklandii]|uniref:UDP-N-acetylenolpyruvoylglucosamine reductase n=1 Tax=Acetoanaerobium sticklandii (strain ATCC 12662 / DSM 519 / JCM 1433 / CCUG 9281 / NCIMB 10654 / HF) TaxID=499177 RepID=E3PUI8_ACESD|nr:YaaR family protein [Acetoanaerobium sticklandii]CBH22426.1 conserved protein of unknown function [Acetoanaerobium sticklandii]